MTGRLELIRDRSAIALLSLALVALSFWLQGDIGINLADEGFLWYGTARAAQGDVPLRDFQSYDIGRYYWGAAGLKVFGSGIIPLRESQAMFQFIGLACGLLTLRRVLRSWWMLTLSGVLLLGWMYPLYRAYETTISLAGVYFAVLLLENPTPPRHFIAGVFVGAAALFGRNHGVYGFVGFLLLIIFIWWKICWNDLAKRILAWSAGILVGYSPMVVMLILVPGFLAGFRESMLVMFHRGTPNLALPIPWPWLPSIHSGQLSFLESAKLASVGVLFLLLPVFYISAGATLLASPRETLRSRALLVASAFIGVMYMHHAFSRADIVHLASSIHPVLIGLIALPYTFAVRRAVAVALFGALFVISYYSVGTASPYFRKASAPTGAYVHANIGGDRLWVGGIAALVIDTVSRINAQRVRPGEGLLVAPHGPGFYPILQRTSPLWDLYFLFPETELRQKDMIARLRQQNVNWVILGDSPLDGRDDLRFRNTHPLVWNHFMDEFETVPVDELRWWSYQLLHRKPDAHRARPRDPAEPPRP